MAGKLERLDAGKMFFYSAESGLRFLFFAPCPPSRAAQARRAGLSEKQNKIK
jgi:hypothetical protein